MKIGILTYHRAPNYGSALQAYALSRYLNDRGQSAQVIDYHSPGQDTLLRLYTPARSLSGIGRNLYAFRHRRAFRRKQERFESFRRDYLPLSATEYTDSSDLAECNDQYDRFVCGSDQIWNPLCTDFTDAYLLRFVAQKQRCVSYAASLALESLPEAFSSLFFESLRDFAALSMRESQGAQVIQELVGREVSVVPDPVLLLSADEWRRILPPRQIKKKYIFCYYIGDTPGMRRYARDLRRATGYELVMVNRNLRELFYTCKKCYDAGPLEFLSLLAHSEFVCTNSFHAVMFSLIFQKNFRAFVAGGKTSSRSRIDHIAARMGLADRVTDFEVGPMPKLQLDTIDFESISPRVAQYASEGKDFLNHCFDIS